MKQFLISILFLLAIVNSAFSDTIPCRFEFGEGKIRCGKVIVPEKDNRKVIVLMVNHRSLRSEDNFQKEMVEKFMAQGISFCYFYNRPLHSEDSTSTTTLFDMADDAVVVYNELRKDKKFLKYKIGFIGASEAGASALIAAAKVKQPDFLIQLVTNVNTQDKKDFHILSYLNPGWMNLFTSDRGFGMPYHDVSYMYQMMIYDMKHSLIGDVDEYAQKLYRQYEGKIKNQKEMFTWAISAWLKKQIKEDGIPPRLWWNAKPYYEFVKCPILFLSAKDDVNVLCAPNVVEFEKTMFENQNKNFTTLVVDATHFLLDSFQSYKLRHGQEVDNTKRYEIYDTITKWLVNTTL